MNTFRTLAVCALALALALPVLAADKNPAKPGKWQWSIEMEIPGMPFKMPAVKFVTCVTEEDVKSAIPQEKKKKGDDCQLGEYEVDGNTIRWTTSCPKQKMTGKGEITYKGDSMTGQMLMVTDGQETKAKYSAKYLGACE